jgi:PAS domain S-box-containing protein
VEVYSGPLVLMGKTLLYSIVHDVTDQRKALEKLREAESTIRLLLDSTAEGIYSVDANDTCTTCNSSCLRLLGYERPDELLGKNMHQLIHSKHPDRSPFPEEECRMIETMREGRGIHVDDEVFWRSDGTPFATEYWSYPLLRDGVVLGAVVTFLDITERKKAEEDVRTLNAELEAFSYSVSHDLRAPLRSIDGFSQAAIEDSGGVLPELARQDLERVRLASQRMGQLIDNMLLLSRVTRSEMHVQQVDMTELARDAASDLISSNPGRVVQLDVEPGMTALGDPRLLHIVFANLLDNAWKFTSRHEHAHVAVGTVEDPDHGHAFFVRDDGAGFDPRYASKLFVAFQRLHSLEEFPGTGIGLATVWRAVRRHGGSTWAEGEIDHGATFYFTIPDLHTPILNKEE